MMDWASLPLAIFIYLISAGFIIATLAAVTVGGVATGRYGEAPQAIDGAPVNRSIYDKIVASILRSVAWIILIASVLVKVGVVMPTLGYEWLNNTLVIFIAVSLGFAGNELHFVPEDLGDRDLRRRRLLAIAWTAAALLLLYFVISGV